MRCAGLCGGRFSGSCAEPVGIGRNRSESVRWSLTGCSSGFVLVGGRRSCWVVYPGASGRWCGGAVLLFLPGARVAVASDRSASCYSSCESRLRSLFRAGLPSCWSLNEFDPPPPLRAIASLLLYFHTAVTFFYFFSIYAIMFCDWRHEKNFFEVN